MVIKHKDIEICNNFDLLCVPMDLGAAILEVMSGAGCSSTDIDNMRLKIQQHGIGDKNNETE